jgi:branched-chain amino acid transport system substrate-binding protein
MLRKSRFVLVGLTVIAIILTACQPQVVAPTATPPPQAVAPTATPPPQAAAPSATPPPTAEAATIRIGGLGPLSAPGDVVSGIAMQYAMNLAVADINAAGGILGKKVELVFGDTEGLPERGTAVAERLINNDKVVALTGEYHSAVGLAELEVAHKYGIPVVFAETWSDQITETGYPEVFRIAPTSTMNSKASADWMVALGIKTVVIIAENTDYGTNQVATDKSFFDAAGIKVTDTIFVDPKTSDFQPILARIQAMNPPPDLIRVPVTGQAGYNLDEQMIDLGIAPSKKTIGTFTSDALAPEYWQSVPNGNYAVFSYTGLPPSLYNDTTKHVVSAYEKVFNTEPASYVLEAYDSVWIIADAIKKAGTTEPKALITAIEGTDVVLAQGRYWFKYTSKNPLPTDGSVPKYMWHQWPDPAILLMEYFKPKQDWKDAAIIWPPVYQTYHTAYIPFGTTP